MSEKRSHAFVSTVVKTSRVPGPLIMSLSESTIKIENSGHPPMSQP
jgi:hypothetical protein